MIPVPPPISTAYRATHALSRAWWCALVFGGLGVLLGRPVMFILAVPFIVHVAWAWWRRPMATSTPMTTPRSAQIAEGDGLKVVVEVPGADLITLQPQATTVEFLPHTAFSAGGSVELVAAPDSWGRHRVPSIPLTATHHTGAWRANLESDPLVVTVRPDVSRLVGGSGVRHPRGISGLHRSRDRGEGTDLAGIREFRAGDRMKRINWRVSSRTGDTHVNTMFVERDTDVLIVVDTFVDHSSGNPRATSSLDQIARALVAITQHYVSYGDRIAIHDLGGRIGHVRPGSGPRQAKTVLAKLAVTRRGPEERRFRHVPRLAPGTLVFFCSALLDDNVRAELIRLRQLGGEVVVVDVLPEELGQVENIGDFREDTLLGEAWVLRRWERDEALARLEELGIPVTTWRGPTSLAAVLRAMEAAREAPRRIR